MYLDDSDIPSETSSSMGRPAQTLTTASKKTNECLDKLGNIARTPSHLVDEQLWLRLYIEFSQIARRYLSTLSSSPMHQIPSTVALLQELNGTLESATITIMSKEKRDKETVDKHYRDIAGLVAMFDEVVKGIPCGPHMANKRDGAQRNHSQLQLIGNRHERQGKVLNGRNGKDDSDDLIILGERRIENVPKAIPLLEARQEKQTKAALNGVRDCTQQHPKDYHWFSHRCEWYYCYLALYAYWLSTFIIRYFRWNGAAELSWANKALDLILLILGLMSLAPRFAYSDSLLFHKGFRTSKH